MLEPIVKTVEVSCSCEQAFQIFINDVSTWWPLDKNSVSAMNGKMAKKVVIEAQKGGKVVELAHDDQEHRWGTVTEFNPHNDFKMDWHIGMSADSPSEVAVVFTDLGNGKTKVELTHSRWESFGDKAADMRDGYNSGWVGVFEEAYKQACSG